MNEHTPVVDDAFILLEDFTPYHRSLKWEIQRHYYAQQGKRAWLQGEVPYYITCNPAAARQNAELVHATARSMTEEGILSEEAPVRVLELASGLGLFAINFLHAFHDLDREHHTGFSQRLRYLFTDLSEKSLSEAIVHPTLRSFRDAGVVEFYRLNAMEPNRMRSVESHEFLATPPLTAVIALRALLLANFDPKERRRWLGGKASKTGDAN